MYVYMCTGCNAIVEFQTSTRNSSLARTDLTLVTQIAFITGGCTHVNMAVGAGEAGAA